MTLKEKRLQILSLAMDINEKYGAVCFIRYNPHTDAMYIELFDKPWELNLSCKCEFIAYGKSYSSDNVVKTHDEVIEILKDILENGLKK